MADDCASEMEDEVGETGDSKREIQKEEEEWLVGRKADHC